MKFSDTILIALAVILGTSLGYKISKIKDKVIFWSLIMMIILVLAILQII